MALLLNSIKRLIIIQKHLVFAVEIKHWLDVLFYENWIKIDFDFFMWIKFIFLQLFSILKLFCILQLFSILQLTCFTFFLHNCLWFFLHFLLLFLNIWCLFFFLFKLWFIFFLLIVYSKHSIVCDWKL